MKEYGFSPGVSNPTALDWSDDGTHYLDWSQHSGQAIMDTTTAMGLIADWFMWDMIDNKLRYKQPALYVSQGGWAMAPDGKSCWIYPEGYQGVKLVYDDVAKAIKQLAGLN